MSKANTPKKDPLLKDLLQQFQSPELPEGFSGMVMNSVNLKQNPIAKDYPKIPITIKIGIPVFMLICFGLISIFPSDETGILQQVSVFFNGAGNNNFLKELNSSIQAITLPDIKISNSLMWYILGGIGLIWFFVIFENFSRRLNKSK